MLPSRVSGEEGRCRRAHRVVPEAEEFAVMTCRRDGLVALVDIAAGGGPSAPGARERDGQGRLGRHRDGGWRLPKVLINAQGAQGFMARIGMKSLSTLSTLGNWRLPEWDVIHVEISVHIVIGARRGHTCPYFRPLRGWFCMGFYVWLGIYGGVGMCRAGDAGRIPERAVIHVDVLPKVLTKPQDVQVFITHWGMKTMSILSTLGILGRVLDG